MTPEQELEKLSRPERLMLKRAYAKTSVKPLQVQGKHMYRAALAIVDRGAARWTSAQNYQMVLTKSGFEMALLLKRQGWPNCEKGK